MITPDVLIWMDSVRVYVCMYMQLMFMPSKDTSKQDLVATCGDYLRIWPITDEGVNVHEAILLSNVRHVLSEPQHYT